MNRLTKVVIVPRWGGDPSKDWYPWITPILESKGLSVRVLDMPNPSAPTIESWVRTLDESVKPDQETLLVGASVGSQTVLRYLAKIGKEKGHVGGALFVAAWFDVDKPWETLKPWIDTPIDFEAVKSATSNLRVLISDNDPFTSNYEANTKAWESNVGAKVVLEKDAKHFNGSQEESVLREILKLTGSQN